MLPHGGPVGSLSSLLPAQLLTPSGGWAARTAPLTYRQKLQERPFLSPRWTGEQEPPAAPGRFTPSRKNSFASPSSLRQIDEGSDGSDVWDVGPALTRTVTSFRSQRTRLRGRALPQRVRRRDWRHLSDRHPLKSGLVRTASEEPGGRRPGPSSRPPGSPIQSP